MMIRAKSIPVLGIMTFIFVFILSAICINLFYTKPASAYNVGSQYTVYFKSSNTLYYNRVNSTYAIIDWIPTITVDKDACDATGSEGVRNFNNYQQYWNCHGLYVQEDNSATAHAGNGTWFEQANYVYQLGDVDWGETVKVGGGTITAHGESTNGTTNSGHDIAAKAGNGPYTGWNDSCDTDNPNRTDHCSILFTSSTDASDFHIFFEAPSTETKHEFWYDGLKESNYRTLTFNPNGGVVIDNKVQTDGTIGDESTIWPHYSGVNLLREYEYNDTANEFPTPTLGGSSSSFMGWYTAASGGTRITQIDNIMSDDTLYAQWIDWDITPSIAINTTSAHPSDILRWTHGVINNGPDSTHIDVYYDYINGGNFPTPYGTGADCTRSAGWPSGTRYYWSSSSCNSTSSSNRSSYTVSSSDGGKDLCRATRVWPGASDDATLRTSSSSCAHIPYNYVLTPTLQLSDSTIEPGTTATVRNMVIQNRYPDNQTYNTQSKNVNWRLTKIVIPKTAAKPSYLTTPGTPPYISSKVPCTGSATGYFWAAGVFCPATGFGEANPLVSGTSSISANGQIDRTNTTGLANYQDNATDYEIGDRICYALSVEKYKVDEDIENTNWAHSGVVCAVVGKSPKVQIRGSDLRSGRNVVTSRSTMSSPAPTRNFGSWVEYAIFSTGSITNTGSAAAFSSSNGLPTSSSYTKLSFANTPAATPGYYYASQPSIPDVAAALAGPDVENHGDYTLTGPLTISSTRIIKSTGTVTIRGGDITYPDGPYVSIASIPQLVIIARNINIENTVGNLDAWLIATTSTSTNRTINTCSDVAVGAPLSDTICANKLTVNGPVMADRLYLRRTAGAATKATIGEPAEVFNLRADAYLWAINRASASNRIRTTYTIELPPRY